MKNYSKPVSVLAKIMEVSLWVGSAICLAWIILSFAAPGILEGQLIELNGASLDALGLYIDNANLETGFFRWIVLYLLLSLILFAMICRNIAIISKRLSRQKTFSEENSPFDGDTVRMVREIGIFSIAQCVIAFLFSILLRLIGPAGIETGVSMNGLLFGLIILYLSSIFAYGFQLQKDVDGLV